LTRCAMAPVACHGEPAAGEFTRSPDLCLLVDRFCPLCRTATVHVMMN
jgi:hypothetical protein